MTGGVVAWWLNSYVRHSLVGAGWSILVYGSSAGDAVSPAMRLPSLESHLWTSGWLKLVSPWARELGERE